MEKQGRVLIVDNLVEWREELVQQLKRNGFYANSASTIEEALKLLLEDLYHVVIVDIRMNETDRSNQEGIDLLENLKGSGLNKATEVIMLSAYGTKEYTLQALKDYKVADFLFKENFSEHNLIKSIKHVFATKVNINLNLDLHLQPRTKLEQLVVHLNIGGTRIKHNSPLQSQLAEELEDLLCRLFYQADNIAVRPLTPGYSGTKVLLVQPYYTDKGVAREVIVKFGESNKIQQEYNNFKDYVQPFVSNGHSTTMLDNRYTPHLGGIIYSLLDIRNDQLVDFETFYQRSEVDVIRDALDRLFLKTCGAWYNNRKPLQPLDLSSDYQRLFSYTPRKLEQALSKQIKFTQGRQRFLLTALHSERTFTNPWQAIAGISFKRFTHICTTHGDFNQHNLLMDNNGNTWLIDFQETGPSHILRDIAMLDSVVRFQLLKQEVTLEERLHLEETLCSITSFQQAEQLSEAFSSEKPALAKAFATVIHLRKLAHQLAMQNQGNDDISEYHIALLFTALNTLQFFSLIPAQREHALLCASLLADQLLSAD